MTYTEKPLRLAILAADTPQPNTDKQYGGYGGVFTSMMRKACESQDPPQKLEDQLIITVHDVVNNLESYPRLDEIDAVLISGSKHTAYDNDAWILKLVEYTQQAFATNRVKVIGVCFGHQIVGRAVGGKLGKSTKGWEVAVTEIGLTEKGKEIFGQDSLRIQQMHQDIVNEFPEGAIALASNEKCTVQAMYSPGKYITVQGHPEFTGEIMTEILTVRHGRGLFKDDLFNDGMKRATIDHDGIAIARAFLRFIRRDEL